MKFIHMNEIWKAKLEKEHSWELPIVIPLVIYHGKSEWHAVKRLRDLIQGYDTLPVDLRMYIPDFEYIYFDLTAYADEEIKGDAKLKTYLTICRDILTKDAESFKTSIYKAISYLMELENPETRMVYFKIMMTYIFSATRNLTKRTTEQVIMHLENIYPEGREVIVTLADIYREEGKKEGKKEGKREGELKGKLDVAKKLKQKGVPTGYILEVTGLGKEDIEKI